MADFVGAVIDDSRIRLMVASEGGGETGGKGKEREQGKASDRGEEAFIHSDARTQSNKSAREISSAAVVVILSAAAHFAKWAS